MQPKTELSQPYPGTGISMHMFSQQYRQPPSTSHSVVVCSRLTFSVCFPPICSPPNLLSRSPSSSLCWWSVSVCVVTHCSYPHPIARPSSGLRLSLVAQSSPSLSLSLCRSSRSLVISDEERKHCFPSPVVGINLRFCHLIFPKNKYYRVVSLRGDGLGTGHSQRSVKSALATTVLASINTSVCTN